MYNKDINKTLERLRCALVHMIAKARYGGLNEYKANTYSFSRVFRAVLTVLEQTSNEHQCSPEGALALLSKHLQLSEFVPVDEPVHVDIRHDEATLRSFLDKSLLGRKIYLLRVAETLLRLPTRNGYEALDQFELAHLAARTNTQTVEVEKPAPVSAPIKTQPKKQFKTKKMEETVTKLDDVLQRGKSTVAKSKEVLARSDKETLASSGQVVKTNPLLNDFL